MICAVPHITLADLNPGYTYAYLGFLFVIGAIVGSFLNVVALRQLRDEEFVKTPSHCLECNYQLQWYDNIPIISWLLLGGKCRNCKAPIHWQYPVVEAVTGALFATAGFIYGWDAIVIPVMALIASFVVMSVTDFRERVIFTTNALWLVPIGLLVHAFGWDNNLLTSLAWVPRWTMETGTFLDASFWSSLIGVAGVFILFEGMIWLSNKLIGQDAFGHGDTLILMAVAAYLGWELTLATLILGALVTCIFALPMMFYRWIKEKHYGLITRMGGALACTGAMFALSQASNIDKPVFMVISGLILLATCWMLFGFMRGIREAGGFTEVPFGPGLMTAALLLLFFGGKWMPKVYAYLPFMN